MEDWIGARIDIYQAIFTPPVSGIGTYTFYLSGHDQAKLYIWERGATEAEKVAVDLNGITDATDHITSTWSGYRDYLGERAAVSAAVTMDSDKKYDIEVRVKGKTSSEGVRQGDFSLALRIAHTGVHPNNWRERQTIYANAGSNRDTFEFVIDPV